MDPFLTTGRLVKFLNSSSYKERRKVCAEVKSEHKEVHLRQKKVVGKDQTETVIIVDWDIAYVDLSCHLLRNLR